MAEIRSLTGLRGIAAVTVFCAHARETLGEQGLQLPVPVLIQRLFLSGGRQVDIFFVLSGFILAMTYKRWFTGEVRRKDYFKFLQRRFARIYPLHFVMLIAAVALVVMAKLLHAPVHYGLGRFDFATLPEHFLLIHAWNLFGHGVGVWNPPSWSISIEAMAYILFPFFICCTAVWSGRRPWLLIALATACGFGMNALTPWGLDGVAGLARGLTEFALGCMVANVSGSPICRWLQSRPGSLMAVAALAIAFALTADTGFIIGAVTAPLLLSLCAVNPVSRVLGARPIYYLGEISYSIYLGHFLFSSIAYRIVRVEWMRLGTLHTLAGLTFIAGFVLLLSSVTYYAIERPCRDALSGRRRAAVPDMAVETGMRVG